MFDEIKDKVVFYDPEILQKYGQALAKRSLVSETGYFPSGLLGRVTEIIHRRGVSYEIVDCRIKPILGTLPLSQRIQEPVAYIEQQQAVDACLNNFYGRGIVVMPTGVGKSRVMKDLILELGVPTLVVPPSTNLKNQVYHYLKDCFGSKWVGIYDKHIGCNKPIMVANIDSLENARPWHFEKMEAVIIDEFHHSAAATYRKINYAMWSGIYYKFGLTATNFRNNPYDQILLESVLSEEIYTMTPVEAVRKGLIVPIKPIIHTVDNEELVDSSDYHRCYKRFVVANDERNDKIIHYSRVSMQSQPTLILVNQIEHGQHLHERIAGSVFVNGPEGSEFNMKMVERFNDLEIPCLIGSSVIGEGVDTKAAGTVFLANGGKARSRVMQNIGRVVRKFPNKKIGFVHDFQDLNSKMLEKHYEARMEIYREDFGVEATRLV